MLVDLLVVAVLGTLLAWSHLGAFRGWLRSKRLPVEALTRSRYLAVVVLLAGIAGTGWAQLWATMGRAAVVDLVVNGIGPGETRLCHRAQHIVNVAASYGGPVDAWCPQGGGRYVVTNGVASCPVHGKAPP